MAGESPHSYKTQDASLADESLHGYEIRVAGQLSMVWSDWLEGLDVLPEPGGETVLRGPLPDQSALIGVLSRLHALNLTILSVTATRLPVPPPEQWRRQRR